MRHFMPPSAGVQLWPIIDCQSCMTGSLCPSLAHAGFVHNNGAEAGCVAAAWRVCGDSGAAQTCISRGGDLVFHYILHWLSLDLAHLLIKVVKYSGLKIAFG